MAEIRLSEGDRVGSKLRVYMKVYKYGDENDQLNLHSLLCFEELSCRCRTSSTLTESQGDRIGVGRSISRPSLE